MLRRTVEVRRVVVTGLGCVSALGVGAAKTWRGVLSDATGVRRVRDVEIDDRLSVHIAAQVPLEDEPLLGAASERQSRFVKLALLASEEAFADANVAGYYAPDRAGCSVASGVGSLEDAVDATRCIASGKRVSPFFVPRLLTNMAAGAISMRHDLRGPNLCPATACAAGAHAIGEAYRLIERGDADMMLAGASEAAVNSLALHGFARLRALASSYNETPAEAARPFDTKREGFVLGEGAAILVLESLESAIERGATVYAEIVGYGLSADAHHITAPRADGSSAARAISRALEGSRITAEDVGYLNAHAASTPQGDVAEVRAIETAFAMRESPLLVSSTKGATGHLLGAAGAIESMMSVLALRDRLAPHTRNLTTPVDHLPEVIDFVAGGQPRPAPALKAAISTSFGFGGTNAALLFAQPPKDLVQTRDPLWIHLLTHEMNEMSS